MRLFGWWLEKQLHRIYVDTAKKGMLRAIITVSESTRQDLIEFGYPENLVHIAYNGLDREFYRNCLELCKDKEKLVVYVGRITPYKRVEDLVKAWRIVEQERSDAELVMVGEAEPKYLRRLVGLKEKLDLKRVELRTNISRKEASTIKSKDTGIYISKRRLRTNSNRGGIMWNTSDSIQRTRSKRFGKAHEDRGASRTRRHKAASKGNNTSTNRPWAKGQAHRKRL